MKRKQFVVDVDEFTLNVIKMPVGEIVYRKLAQNGTVLNGVNSDINNEKRRFTTRIVKRLGR